MSQSKRREEAAWKSRKHSQKPHGQIKSLVKYADEYDAERSK
jgi:hypothetical protein